MALTWSAKPVEQKQFVANLDAKMGQLDRLVVPATYYDEDVPADTDVVSGTYKRTQWVDPVEDVLKNVYTRVEDSAVANTTTYRPYPLVPAPEWNLLTKIEEISVGAVAGAATLTFSNIPQTFTHLFLYIHVRDTGATVTSTPLLRFNAAAAGYSMSWQGHNGNHSYGGETVSATGFAFTGPAANSVNQAFLDGWFEIPAYASASRTIKMRGRVASMWGSPVTTATMQGYDTFGILNSLAAVTSISWVNTTATAPGTRLVLFGL